MSIRNTVFLLALVDARYKSTVVDRGSYGRNSDGGMFVHSKLGKYLEIRLGITQGKQLSGITHLAPHVFVGEEALPL
jgi:hypothetical protein